MKSMTMKLNQAGLVTELFILMVIFVITAISMGATFAFSTSRAEQAYLTSRLENNRTRMLVESSLGNDLRCAWQFNTPTNIVGGVPTFDFSAVTPTAAAPGVAFASLNRLYYGISAAAPVIVGRNEVSQTSATGRPVEKIQLEQLRSIPATPGQYEAVLAVYYANTVNNIATAPVTVPISFTIDSAAPVNNAMIMGCRVGTGAPVGPAGSPLYMIATQNNPDDQDGGDPAAGESSNFTVGQHCPSGPVIGPTGGTPAPQAGNYSLWYPRSFNCLNQNTIPTASLNRNTGQFTLGPGIYYIRTSALGDGAGLNQTKWVNLTTGADVLLGTVEYSEQNNGDATPSIVEGYFEVATTSTFQLVHRYSHSDPSYPCSFGGAGGILPTLPNIYAHLHLELIQ